MFCSFSNRKHLLLKRGGVEYVGGQINGLPVNAKGDANGDRKVNAVDIVYVVNATMGNPLEGYKEEAADVNGDGIVNEVDIALVGNIILGKSKIPFLQNEQTQKANGSSSHVGSYNYTITMNPAVNDSLINFNLRPYITCLQLNLTLPKAGTYTSVILKTDGQFITEGFFNLVDGQVTPMKESDRQVLSLKNVKISEENLVLEAYLSIVPVDLSENTLSADIIDDKGNCYTIDLKGLNFSAGETYCFTKSEMTQTLPMVSISTPNNQPITSKEEYISNSLISVSDVDGKYFNIKGRGNSTWNAPKKPYAIKFDKKVSLMSLPEDKSWVMLANYFDASLLRNDLAFYMGQKMSHLDYTPHFYSVELTLNGEYKGIYQLGEKLKISKKRVNVGDDGFLLEIDAKAGSDEITFSTPFLEQPVSIKDPDVVEGDDNYNWVKNFVTEAEAALFQIILLMRKRDIISIWTSTPL